MRSDKIPRYRIAVRTTANGSRSSRHAGAEAQRRESDGPGPAQHDLDVDYLAWYELLNLNVRDGAGTCLEGLACPRLVKSELRDEKRAADCGGVPRTWAWEVCRHQGSAAC